MNLHDQKVQRVQQRVRELAKNGTQAKMYHGATNSTRPPGGHNLALIDVSDFDQVLEINRQEMYAIVEPNLPLDALVKATVANGFVPPMVAEFPGITVGGAVQGGSGESSSHLYGLFSDICQEYEVITGDAERLMCSNTQHADLFHGLPCAFGSLGILTAVKLQLIPAKPYANLRYIATNAYAHTLTVLEECVSHQYAFVDAIQFSPDSGVVIVGDYAEKRLRHHVQFRHFWNEWFYLHVKKRLSQAIVEESVPLVDYLFRYDRGAFWVAQYGFQDTWVPFNRVTRLLLAWLFKTRTLFKLMHSSGYAYKYLAQDICLPKETVTDFLRFNDDVMAIYPLWICPLKPTTDKLAPTALDTRLAVNVGLWGAPSKQYTNFRDLNRQIEHEVTKLGGRKVLYAHAYYTEEEFWSTYDKKWYQDLRTQYNASTIFPDVYKKTATAPARFTPSRWRGLRGLIRSPYRQ